MWFQRKCIEALIKLNFEVHDPIDMGGFCMFLELFSLVTPLGKCFCFFNEYQT